MDDSLIRGSSYRCPHRRRIESSPRAGRSGRERRDCRSGPTSDSRVHWESRMLLLTPAESVPQSGDESARPLHVVLVRAAEPLNQFDLLDASLLVEQEEYQSSDNEEQPIRRQQADAQRAEK